MRIRYLTVIKNAEGMHEYDHGIELGDNLSSYELPEDEFEALFSADVFENINKTCGLLIGDYESELIEKKYLKECIEIVENAGIGKVFLDALQEAESNGVALGLDF